jgi:Zn-dependent M28 family amino/carboxypeptidase
MKLCWMTGAALAAGLLIAAVDYEADGVRWWKHVEVLADDKMEGRNAGSPGHRRAAEYVAAEFERAGLKPAGTQAFMQPVALRSRHIEEEKCSLALVSADGKAEPLRLGEDANIGVRSDPPRQVEAEAVFVGYGLQVPELKHDDLAGLDLRGKIAVYLSGAPAFIPGPLAAHLQRAERGKRLRAAGSIGSASFTDPKFTDVPWSRATLARFQPSMNLTEPDPDDPPGQRLGVAINSEHADKWFAGTGHTVAEILELARAEKPLPKFALKVKVRAETAFRTEQLSSQNVAGLLPGADPKLASEYVVISAHLDHLGIGKPIRGDSIYNGAMDDASGVASLIETAKVLASARNRPRRSVLFLAVTGEEKGLLGSRYFAAKPTVNRSSIVADINLDMFLPLFPLKAVVVYGVDESDLGDVSREVGREQGIGVVPDREPKRNIFVRSDQYSFIREGVPALFFKFDAEPGSAEDRRMKDWLRERYHAPSDDLSQPVDKAAAARFNRYIQAVIERVANRDERPRWKETSFFRRFAKGRS